MIGELNERARRCYLHFRAGPGGFGAASGRADESFATGVRADRGRQDAGDSGDRAIEAELAQYGEAGNCVAGDGADRGHQAERNRQIVMAAFLGKIGRGEVDGDAPGRQRQAGGDQRRAHPFARLRDRLVRQTHDVEGGQSGRHLHLDIDGTRLDALECHRRDPLDHISPCSATE